MMHELDANILHELEKLHQYLYGAHHAIDHDEGSQVLHTACHKLDEIIQTLKIYNARNPVFLASSS